MLELINNARANPTAEASRLGISLNQGLSSGKISTAPKQPLAFDGDLVDAAHKHSTWMLDTDTFSHRGAGGSSFTTRMKAEGYVFSGSWTAGENISWGGSTGTINQLAHTLARHDSLFKSPGHRVNILNDNFKEVGLGVEFGKFGNYNASMVTQDFAKTGTASFITGVAYDDRNDNDFYTPGEGRGGIKVTAVSTGTTTPVTVTDITGAAGGYDIAVAPGTYKLTFSEGGLAAPVTQTVTIGSKNVKIDLIDPPSIAAQVAGMSASSDGPSGYTVPADQAPITLLGVPDGHHHHHDAFLAA
ncbi:CAP domain-containing protein (plasmid) [Skermanella mucosa]|uniref:CAP domain-containing protein n=1 Tax=Skermanella mucosa TaxID=1789672 RepID=UPI00192AE2E5|nr:CAP domain-containing protein [Skermanella mucosa]UEM25293.1 CAP domain-containing protein [Skermanella mucosa]